MTRYGGIDLGGTKIQAVVVDERHVVLGEARHPTPTEGGPADVAAAMSAAMTEAAGLAGVRTDALAGVGVGSPGDVDAQHGTVTAARNLPDWEGEFALGDALEKALGSPARLGNDVQVATDAEFELGAAREFESLLGVFWGTGVGGGIILDSKPWYGRGASGEIGHVVVEIGGARCPCGRRGCMEAYAGRGAIVMYVERGGQVYRTEFMIQSLLELRHLGGQQFGRIARGFATRGEIFVHDVLQIVDRLLLLVG